MREKAQLFASKNSGGIFSKAYPAFKADENYTGPSSMQVLKGIKEGKPIYHSKAEYFDFAADQLAE
ncbi:hypothetical protein GCM10023185_27710 [Hymenobacter saemangeumensis]|uniref:Uncharacterized protein n=1 Tax=Hymenobacter saemangeumensis TaxID=1084522 RepID=A0ABP8IJW6_9BACT